ncbi:MAG: enoyl-CoA hydratase/isomerase family protein [Alphaproteobacteria bacterium]
MARLDLEIRDSGVAVLRFVNPPTGLLTGAMAVELEAQVQQLADDPSVRVVILTGGQPDVFIRHFDVAELAMAAEAVREAPPPSDAEWHSSMFHRITRCLEQMGKPTIAAINGVCMGVGYELALACDLRIASHGDYPIGLPEVNIGICPGGGGTVRLTRLLGTARALELLYTGQTCVPDQAAMLGLVNWVAADALADALVLAGELTARSAAALAAIKQVSRASADLEVEAALTVEQRVANTRLASQEMAALMRQMNELGLDIRDVRARK